MNISFFMFVIIKNVWINCLLEFWTKVTHDNDPQSKCFDFFTYKKEPFKSQNTLF